MVVMTNFEEEMGSSHSFSKENDYESSDGSFTSHEEEKNSSTDEISAEEVDKGKYKSSTNVDDVNPDLIRTKMFKSVDEAEEFYISYGRENGFDVRKSTIRTKKGCELVVNRTFVCFREGYRTGKIQEFERKRKAKFNSRCGCKARLRIALVRTTGEYGVTDFIVEHTHALETSETAHRLRCNRYLTPSTKRKLNMMTDMGFRPCKILDYIEELGGGNEFGVLNRKDGYNYLNRERLKRIEGGDVNTVLGLLEGMKLKDESLIFKSTVDGNGALTRLFWCDGHSRAEYELYGDVILFDSTYKTNMYRFPLIIFSGVNSHLVTCVFGAAIMYNETIESYRWLLRTFRECMNGKKPIAVLTDQDPSMYSAIKSEFPDAVHRLCCWHISRNAENNVKVVKFSTAFSEVMRSPCSIEEFDTKWSKFIEDYKVVDHKWVKDIYLKRHQWAEAFFRGHFFAMMRSTQRAEAMNSSLKQRVQFGNTLTDFFRQYVGNFLKRIRRKFYEIQIESECTVPKENQGGLLRSLENHAARICTKAIYGHIWDEIRKDSEVIVQTLIMAEDKRFEFICGDYTTKEVRNYLVIIDITDSKFECECLMLQSDGIPCRHLICGFKNMKISSFPDKSIHSRWFIATGTKLRMKFPFFVKDANDNSRRRFEKMTNEDENQRELQSDSSDVEPKKSLKSNETSKPKYPHNVLDPEKIIPKGGVKGKRHCTSCKQEGHNKATCWKYKQQSPYKDRVNDDTMPTSNSCMNSEESQSRDSVDDNYHTQPSKDHDYMQPSTDESFLNTSSFRMPENFNSFSSLLYSMMHPRSENTKSFNEPKSPPR